MRVDNILGLCTIVLVFLAWWFFKDPAMASHRIGEIFAASGILRS